MKFLKITSFKNKLAQQAASIFSLRVFAIGIGFLSNIALARILSLEEFGLYTFILGWYTLLLIAGGLGAKDLLIREVAIYQSRGQKDLLIGIIR